MFLVCASRGTHSRFELQETTQNDSQCQDNVYGILQQRWDIFIEIRNEKRYVKLR